LRVLHVSPQKSGKLFARMRLAERQGEIGEERQGLFGREDDCRTGSQACFKSAKKLELQVRLGRHGSSTGPPPATTAAQITPFSTVLATIRIRSPDTTEEEGSTMRLGSAALRYGLAVTSVAAASSFVVWPPGRQLVPDPLERLIDIVTLQHAAVVFSAWLGGIGPGLLAVVLAVLTIDYFVTPPLYDVTLDVNYLPRLALFALSALLVGWLGVRRRRMAEALRRAHDELEARVRERTADLTRSNQQLHDEIVARKRAEEVLRAQAELLDLTHDTVFVRDAKDVITYWNHGAVDRYGWTPDEAVGQVSHDLLRTVFPAPFDDIMVELTCAGRWEGELVHTRRDGTTVVVASRWSLQRGDEGGLGMVLETNNDITERKRAEESLRQARTELAHVTRVMTLGELAASIAHEVTQPLAAIVTNGDACLRLLAADRPNPSETGKAVASIIRDARRAVAIVDRVRALLKKSAVDRAPVDLGQVIRDVLALVQSEVARHRIVLRTSLADDLPPVLGDRIQLQQVVLNLLTNAIEAMRDVTGRRRGLLVSAGRHSIGPDAGVLVAVEDAGGGFEPTSVDQLFQALYTTKSDGLGMGLSISRSIVLSHGGRLWATPNAGHGATFQFVVPARKGQDHEPR
jgi:PAS domain S-box-containing protein